MRKRECYQLINLSCKGLEQQAARSLPVARGMDGDFEEKDGVNRKTSGDSPPKYSSPHPRTAGMRIEAKNLFF